MTTRVGPMTLLVRQMRWEADDVLSVTLVDPDGKELPPFSPGAHLDLKLTSQLSRQYSICSSPRLRAEWRVAVLREPESRGGSSYIHEVLRPGMKICVTALRNDFVLVDAGSYLFIGGGIGVTPLLPMIEQAERAGADWHLLYGGRRRSAMAFLPDLQRYGSRVTVVPQDADGYPDLHGAIRTSPAGTAVYCCGPSAMLAAVEEACAEAGRKAPHIERFEAPDKPAGAVADPAADTEFEVVLARSKKRLTVPAGKSIADVLMEADVWVSTSCTEGYCGMCETAVLAGVPDHRDDYLSDDVRSSNRAMMVCVSRSKTPELTLDV